VITLRPARDDDYDFLSDLHEASMRTYIEAVWGWDDEFQVQFFRDHFQPERLQIIELDGVAVGVIGFDTNAERLYIGPFEVDPDVQGRGVGSAAMTQVLAIANGASVPATLQVLQVNPDAKRLYERLGFEVAGETDTHVLMRRPVGPLSHG
jgi:ribosomal protein S18 acetylase RimI-like enzyme